MINIELVNILYALLPLVALGIYYAKVVGNTKEIAYATARMLLQLLLIGYVLIYIFENDNVVFGFIILFIMVLMSSLIILRNIEQKSWLLFVCIFISIAIGGSINLVLVVEFVLELERFYEPRYVIPLAGMVYASSMTSVSLAAERFEKEVKNLSFEKAHHNAFKASMIPNINSFLAVGLVSLPGMMTGQILSGVDPLIAVRYQIVVMAMILGSAGLSVMLYFSLFKRFLRK